MNLKLKPQTFDDFQQALMREMIEQIRFKLVETGLQGEKLKDLTCSLAFSVASSIDDTASIEYENLPVKPFLTFINPEDNTELLHSGDNSFMHEYVTRLIDDVFKD